MVQVCFILGNFRKDLFYRIHVFPITLPPLRERRDDIPRLAYHFLRSFCRQTGKRIEGFSNDALEVLINHDWPGNVRQLQNTCRWLTVMSPGQVIHLDDLPSELLTPEYRNKPDSDWQEALRFWTEQQFTQGETAILDKAVPIFETVMIETALRKASGRRQDAAKLLGWGRNTLTRKIKELGLEEGNIN